MKKLFEASFVICAGWELGLFVSDIVLHLVERTLKRFIKKTKAIATKNNINYWFIKPDKKETRKTFDKEILGFRA